MAIVLLLLFILFCFFFFLLLLTFLYVRRPLLRILDPSLRRFKNITPAYGAILGMLQVKVLDNGKNLLNLIKHESYLLAVNNVTKIEQPALVRLISKLLISLVSLVILLAQLVLSMSNPSNSILIVLVANSMIMPDTPFWLVQDVVPRRTWMVMYRDFPRDWWHGLDLAAKEDETSKDSHQSAGIQMSPHGV